MLFFAMMAILFTKHSRFADIKRKLEDVKQKKEKLLTIFLLFFSLFGFSQNHSNPTTKINYLDSIKNTRFPKNTLINLGDWLFKIKMVE